MSVWRKIATVFFASPLFISGVVTASASALSGPMGPADDVWEVGSSVPFASSEPQDGVDVSEPLQRVDLSAEGMSWAPGGPAAYNDIYVKGNGIFVKDARVAYFAGIPAMNACVDTFEISYYEHGERRVETHDGHCGVGRVKTTFPINRNLDLGTPFCGKVQVGGQWGNDACINIEE